MIDPIHLLSEHELIRRIAEGDVESQLLGRELERRMAPTPCEQEIEHRWGKRDADIFRLDEYGQLVLLRGEHGRRFWQHPEGYDQAYLAAIALALNITAGYRPGAPG